MDNYGSSGLNTTSRPSRKRRSNLHRRPTTESDYSQEHRDSVSLSSTPSDHVSDAPSEGNVVHDVINQRNGLSNECISRASYTNLTDAETVNRGYDEGEVFDDSIDLKRSVEDNPAEACWKNLNVKDYKASTIVVVGGPHSGQIRGASDGIENKFNKVKLKVGGVTHSIHARSSSDGSSAKSATLDEINTKENFNVHSTDEKGGLRGVPWKDFSRTGFGFSKVEASGVDIQEEFGKQALTHDGPSKSKSRIKNYSADEAYDVDEEDDEIRYLLKLKTSRIASFDYTEYEDETRVKKLRKISRVMDRNIDNYHLDTGDYDSRSIKESKKSRSVRAYEDTDYREDEESVSDGEIEHKKKKQRKVSIDVSEYSKESSITTRRRAILAGRDISPALDSTPIQFPDGLPPAPPRKPKDQLSEVEQQLKRAEAAQRRKVQNEKAARESEAEAIRKILGQDSSRKKREEKIRKRQEELAQERNTSSAFVASNAVRWVMGPSGTVVIFPDEIGLPSIFEPRSSSYPPPREKCAGPSCTNVYKYRDSKSKLPLCSLQCYKAINEKVHRLHAC
ncbi:hypothetical protein ACS0TY_005552 [Phlomoides rotata]